MFNDPMHCNTRPNKCRVLKSLSEPLVVIGIPFLSCRGDMPKNDNTKVTLGHTRRRTSINLFFVGTKNFEHPKVWGILADAGQEVCVFLGFESQDFPEELQSNPSRTYPSRPDPLRTPCTESGQNQVQINQERFRGGRGRQLILVLFGIA